MNVWRPVEECSQSDTLHIVELKEPNIYAHVPPFCSFLFDLFLRPLHKIS